MKAITDLQSEWARLTKQELHPRATERLFFGFHNEGFTCDDLRCVVEYYQRFNRQNNGAQFRINAQKICGDIEAFASVLAEARAKERNRPKAVTPKEQVINLRERPVDVEKPATGSDRHVSDVFKTLN